MQQEQRERIIKRHSHSIWLHGYTAQALYWENEHVQKLRFDVLLACGLKSGDSVLDVGCGFGDLYHHMKEKGLAVDYTGIDLSPDMITAAKATTPDGQFCVGDFFDVNPAEKSYDWVLLSGALNEPLKDDGEYLRAIIPRLYKTCRKGLAFNLLNDAYGWTPGQRYSLQPYNVDEVLGLLKPLCSKLKTRDDYLPVDVSYFAWRDEIPVK